LILIKSLQTTTKALKMKVLATLMLLVSLIINGCATEGTSGTKFDQGQPKPRIDNPPEVCAKTTQQGDLMHTCFPYLLDLQKRLSKMGYYKEPVNGMLGDKKGDDNETVIALKGFQTDNGLKASGILDEETRAKLGMPRGLTASISNFKVKKARIVTSDKVVGCGTSSNKALEVTYEYEIIWTFSDFSGEMPRYDFERQIVGNNGKYDYYSKERIGPKVEEGYKPGQFVTTSGKQTSKDDQTLTLSSTCREVTAGNIKVQTLVEPMKGPFEFTIFLQGQKYRTVFTAL
jgi:peptidoglycan hydrolase-like protein with peptidoglycan-binding domain